MESRSAVKRNIIIDLFYVAVILVFAAAAVIIDQSSVKNYSTDIISLHEGWVSDDGRDIDLDSLPAGELRVSADISGYELGSDRLCLESIDTMFDVYADGKLVYSYRPTPPKLLGISYGMNVHAIPIPDGTHTLTMQISPIFPGNSGSIPNAALEDAGTFMVMIFKRNIWNIIQAAITMLVGILFLIIGISNRILSKSMGLDFVSFGVLCALLGFSGLNDTYVLQLLTQHPSIIRVITYLCLMFLPYPSLKFVAGATGDRDTKLLPAIFTLCSANFLASVLLTYSGISDYYYMVRCTHIILALDFAACIYLVVRSVKRKTIRPQLLHSLTAGMGVMIFCAGADLVRYWLGWFGVFGLAGFTRLGVRLFLIITGIYLFREQSRISLETSRAELMKKLAYTDGLTELSNRLAFGQREELLRKENTGCFIVQLDVNDLKKVNDVYGHAEGDRQIIAAAHRIRGSFAGVGDSYRTGGDEFIVISRSGCTRDDIEHSLAELERLTGEYNQTEKPPVPLYIAVGYAEFEPARNSLEEAEAEADQSMYARKKQMKAAAQSAQ